MLCIVFYLTMYVKKEQNFSELTFQMYLKYYKTAHVVHVTWKLCKQIHRQHDIMDTWKVSFGRKEARFILKTGLYAYSWRVQCF